MNKRGASYRDSSFLFYLKKTPLFLNEEVRFLTCARVVFERICWPFCRRKNESRIDVQTIVCIMAHGNSCVFALFENFGCQNEEFLRKNPKKYVFFLKTIDESRVFCYNISSNYKFRKTEKRGTLWLMR
jgi:hypothetical protein